VLDHVGAQVIADGLGVPEPAREEVLDGIGGAVAGGLGELPAVFCSTGASRPRR
jgi:hypothetical protein